MRVIEALLLGQVQLSDIPSSRLDSQLLLEHVLGKPREWLMAHGDEELTAEQQKTYDDLIAKRRDHTPVVHLTNRREFYGLELEITPDVLTPRVETEQMVDWAIKYAPKGTRLTDIGTGSGAIAIAIAKHRPDLEVWATEVSPKALEIAKRNANRNDVQIHFRISDLWDAFGVIPTEAEGSIRTQLDSSTSARNDKLTFDTVVTNLPYLKDDADLMPEVQKEPAVALFGGPDGLDIYRRFLKDLPEHLSKGGYLFTECDPWQQADLIKEAKQANLTPIEQGYFILGFRHE